MENLESQFSLSFVIGLVKNNLLAINTARLVLKRPDRSIKNALFASLVIGPYVIDKLSDLQLGQTVREDGPQSHLSKAGTPTMGGVLILIVIVITTLLWGDLSSKHVWIVLLVKLKKQPTQ